MNNTELSNAPTPEITAELEDRYRAKFNPPAGFRLEMSDDDIKELDRDPAYSGLWNGPESKGSGHLITSQWSNTGGLVFYADHTTAKSQMDDEPFTPAQALEMAAALTALVHQVTV